MTMRAASLDHEKRRPLGEVNRSGSASGKAPEVAQRGRAARSGTGVGSLRHT